MRDARTSRFQQVARRDLCYASENKGFHFHNFPIFRKLGVCVMFFGVLSMKTKKMRDARTIILAAVSRRDLCYASENKGFRFPKNNQK